MSEVAVLAGGRSSEREVSLASGASVLGGLLDAGHSAALIEIDAEGAWRSDGQMVSVEPGRGLPGFDVVFPVVHGPWGEDGTLQGLLESLRIPFVGSGVYASALCIDKILAKERMAQVGLPQVDFVAVTSASWHSDRRRLEAEVSRLGLPVWVKPARLGSSVGISRVDGPEGLADAVALALRHDPRVIVEASSTGREIEVSVMERPLAAGGFELVASPAGEITLPGAAEGEWYDYERKYESGGMELVVPAAIGQAAAALVTETAIAAFEAAGCSGYARVDCFVEEDRVLVNEINTAPGFTRTSVFGRLFEAGGVAYPQLLDLLVRRAIDAHDENESYIF